MTVTCKSFRCTPLPDGWVRLDLDSPQSADESSVSPVSSQVLYIDDIARKLKKDPKSVRRMSQRRSNPLPLNRSNGRPFIIESDLFYFITSKSLSRRYP